MSQPPNLNKMLEQAQQMLAQQQEAQEKLKDCLLYTSPSPRDRS